MVDRKAPFPGECEAVLPGIRKILAPNPSPLTQNGTNTYILGSGDVAVIDPGPAIPTHLDAIMAALAPGERVSHIVVTHAHLDHSGLASLLAKVSGAPVFGFGTAISGRSDTMIRLANSGAISGGEGLDHDFNPDVTLAHGARLAADSWALEAIHTPGHLGGHLCYASGNILFSGDHVMGWSTSLVSPPDGDMTQYMASIARLAKRSWTVMLPGHGDPIHSPAQRIHDLIAHRRAREAAILDALRSGIHEIDALTRQVYADLADILVPAAQRNVLAHLIDLEARNLVYATTDPSQTVVYAPR